MTTQVKPYNLGDSVDALPASGSVQDVGNMPMKLHQASECVRERLEPKEEKNSPSRPREKPDNLGGETAVPGSVHDVQECPRRVRNKYANEMDTPGRVTGNKMVAIFSSTPFFPTYVQLQRCKTTSNFIPTSKI